MKGPARPATTASKEARVPGDAIRVPRRCVRGRARFERCQMRGPVPSGSFCPRGSLRLRPCGSEDRYCPAGSSAPVLADAGAYTTPQTASAWDASYPECGRTSSLHGRRGANCTAAAIASEPLAPRQTGIQQCEPGHFCIHGIKFRCPERTLRVEHELKTPNCTAACPAGTYCPEGSIEPSLLPAGRYSPKKELRSWNQASLCPAGSYCPPGAAAPSHCPAGRFGDRVGLESAACPARIPTETRRRGAPRATSDSERHGRFYVH